MRQPGLFHWCALVAAILLEVIGTTLMKLSHAWTFPHALIAGLALMWLAIGLSYWLLALAATGLPVGVAYAFWEGLGLSLVTLSSIFILGEKVSASRLLGIACLLCGALLVHKGTAAKKEGKS